MFMLPIPGQCKSNMPQPVRQRPSQRLTKKRITEAQNERPASRKRTVEGKLRHTVV